MKTVNKVLLGLVINFTVNFAFNITPNIHAAESNNKFVDMITNQWAHFRRNGMKKVEAAKLEEKKEIISNSIAEESGVGSKIDEAITDTIESKIEAAPDKEECVIEEGNAEDEIISIPVDNEHIEYITQEEQDSLRSGYKPSDKMGVLKADKSVEPKNDEVKDETPEVVKITEPINTITITTPTTVADLSLNVHYK